MSVYSREVQILIVNRVIWNFVKCIGEAITISAFVGPACKSEMPDLKASKPS